MVSAPVIHPLPISIACPLDQLKIDQTIVRGIADEPNDAVLVKTIIVMANTLGLSVIAEGVETDAQLDILQLYGCPAFQGYLFGMPAPILEFERLLGHSETRDRQSTNLYQ